MFAVVDMYKSVGQRVMRPLFRVNKLIVEVRVVRAIPTKQGDRDVGRVACLRQRVALTELLDRV